MNRQELPSSSQLLRFDHPESTHYSQTTIWPTQNLLFKGRLFLKSMLKLLKPTKYNRSLFLNHHGLSLSPDVFLVLMPNLKINLSLTDHYLRVLRFLNHLLVSPLLLHFDSSTAGCKLLLMTSSFVRPRKSVFN